MQSQLQVVDIFAHYLAKVEAAISPGRLDRYMAAAGHDRRMALKLYVWNASICEAFYTPLKFCEVTLRNAILSAIRTRYGPAWYTDSRFRGARHLSQRSAFPGHQR